MTDSSQQQQQQQQQQFCLRWNNFQANITSQFEALRDDEDFVDVTFACDGRRLQAHKVVLSACSPYFKELFKTNPCKHPIIFMRDVEFEHLQSLLEFMYAGEVNISQAELPTFLRTAESLQIRGLTDSQSNQHNNEKYSKLNNINASNGRGLVSPNFDDERSKTPPSSSPPPLKRLCKSSDSPRNSSPAPAAPSCATTTPRSRPLIEPQVQLDCYKDMDIVEPKVELPEYGSDDESKQDLNALPGGFLSLDGGMEVLPSYPPTYSGSGIEGGMPGPSHGNTELNQEQQADLRKLHSLDPRPCPVCNRMYSNLSNLRQHIRLIHNPQSVTCPLCSKPFKTKLYLKRHLVSFHDLSVAERQRQEEIYHHHQPSSVAAAVAATTAAATSNSSSSLKNSSSSSSASVVAANNNNTTASSTAMTTTTTAASSPSSSSEGKLEDVTMSSPKSDLNASAAGQGFELDSKTTSFAGGMIQFNATFH
ncbi:protein abrupt-like isoform X2 [Phymastichus coffea]|uniref:protein abrupt-like isoform X2 n=1 Tax=Phymastichus coffea TaxID=108790 RepID=UPI00273B742F|nr:protein abrupt-like isoform X2 [Phymastichus coffea]